MIRNAAAELSGSRSIIIQHHHRASRLGRFEESSSVKWRRTGLSAAALTIASVLSGCGGGATNSAAPGGGNPAVDSAGQIYAIDEKSAEEKQAILKSIIQLIQSASSNPGGTNFDQATELLNQYFLGTSPEEFALSSDSRSYLANRLGEGGEKAIKDLENPAFTVRDARHIEDSLLAYSLAMRIAGDGEDLDRVRRVFDWVTRQIVLVPPNSLAPPNLPQAKARPFDVLLRGMATEDGVWAERTWLFMSLCRQLNIDTGLLLYNPRSLGLLADPESARNRGPVVWVCAALIDGKPYLFDARLGLPIPKADGKGIATIEEAATDPIVLKALDLPGFVNYQTSAADLSAGKLSILIDSTLGRMTPRMRELQKNLTGKNRMILFRDPAEQALAFKTALGDRFERTTLWPMPLEVDYLLFNDPSFVEATQFPMQIFDSHLPLLPARMGQLRGELAEAVQRYVGFRFGQDTVQSDGKTPIAAPVQHMLDLYSTYFLALAKLDQNESSNAEFLFRETLRLFPEPGNGEPFYSMYRWGAATNLAMIHEARWKAARETPSSDPKALAASRESAALAIRYYNELQPTPQTHGNLLRARAMIWADPFVPDPIPAENPTAATESTNP
jgi:hypothetical protein